MNKLYFILLLLFATTTHVFAQDRGISYQAVAIDADGKQIPGYDVYGNPISGAEISVRFGLYNNSNMLDYEETHQTLTDQFGLFNLVIGDGASTNNGLYSNFVDIAWSMDKKFLKVELDVYGGSDYKLMSYQELLSVPFAKFAENSLNPGPTGVSVVNSYIDINGELILTLSDSTVINAGIVKGPQGVQGLQGLSGDPGAIGPQGTQGIQGLPGATGPQGLPGVQGPIGLTGAQGIQGPAGTDGTDGQDGIDGTIGAQGPIGLTGSQGVQGLTGATGATGPQGLPGVQGPIGLIGPQGIQGLTGATGATGLQGVQGLPGAQGLPGTPADSIDYDSLANIISLDSTFITNVGGGMGSGGCDFQFPEGFNGEAIISQFNYNTFYTVPNGKRLYITGFGQGSLGIWINGIPGGGNPIIANPGDVLSNQSNNFTYFNGFLVPVIADIDAIISQFNYNTFYTVPNGKRLYITGFGQGSLGIYINGIIAGGNPIIANPGDVLSNQSNNFTYFNGYLADENYFAGCGGGSSSSASAVDSAMVAGMIAASLGSSAFDYKFPDGMDGHPITEVYSSNQPYIVPSGKRFYVLQKNSAEMLYKNGNPITSVVNPPLPIILDENDIITSNTAGNYYMSGYLVDL